MAAVSSNIDICNLAMTEVSGGPVLSISAPTTRQEKICAFWYDQTRQECLRRGVWNFAKKRVVLPRSATAPAFSWEDAYNFPKDYIRLLSIGELGLGDDINLEYELENRQILINNGGEALNIIYIFDNLDVTKYDPLFKKFFVLELAKNCAFEITGKNTVVSRLDEDIEKLKVIASAIDGQERPPRRRQSSKFSAARRQGYSVDASRIRLG